MADYRKDVDRLKDPTNIKDADAASSPYVLREFFARDPIIQRLIRGRSQVVPLIEAVLKKDGKKLSEISLAAYAYVLEHVEPAAAERILQPLFKAKLREPGPFFVNIAAHVIRSAHQLPVKPLRVVYTEAELDETLKLFE